jgi:hypothetical protein
MAENDKLNHERVFNLFHWINSICILEVSRIMIGLYKNAYEQAMERDQAIERSKEMHRRAQKLEGIEQHIPTIHAGYRREVKHVRHNAARTILLWKQRYRAAVKQLIDAGVPKHVKGHEEDPRYIEGRLDIMIDRLIAQRDAFNGLV